MPNLPDLTPLNVRRSDAALTFCLRASSEMIEQLPSNYEIVLAGKLAEVLEDRTLTAAEIDLENLPGITSRQLGSLIALGKVLRPRFGSVPMRNASPAVRHLLQLTRTDVLFDVR